MLPLPMVVGIIVWLPTLLIINNSFGSLVSNLNQQKIQMVVYLELWFQILVKLKLEPKLGYYLA